jgi:hypothetical protein
MENARLVDELEQQMRRSNTKLGEYAQDHLDSEAFLGLLHTKAIGTPELLSFIVHRANLHEYPLPRRRAWPFNRFFFLVSYSALARWYFW